MKNLPRVGSALVVSDGDRILLGRRKKEPNRGKWVLPGGKVEPFEPLREAAKREIEEETGLLVEVGAQIGVEEIIDPPSEHRVIVYSWAHPVGGTLRAASDIFGARFCTREELQTLDLSDVAVNVLAKTGWLDREEIGEPTTELAATAG